MAAFSRLWAAVSSRQKSPFHAFAARALAASPTTTTASMRLGRGLVRRMNELGILIDIRHGHRAVHRQLIEHAIAPLRSHLSSTLAWAWASSVCMRSPRR